MRSQVSAEEKPECDEGGLSPERLKDAGEERSPLEAMRELVMMWREAGKLVPENITDDDLQALAKLTTKSSRKKYLKYLAIKEGYKKARKVKQEDKRAKREVLEDSRVRNREAEGDEDMEDEGEHKLKNTFLMQFWGRSLDKLLAWRNAQCMVHGQPLVFDMSYEQNMAKREVENTVSQLLEVEGWNRRAKEPFHLHFCNLQPDSGYQRELTKRYGAEAWERLLITTTDKHHVDMFPPERLVYLTADSRNVLRTYDHSKVYIIGSLVDRSIQSGLSLANAKRLNLATARLPLDEFLHWEIGAKNLTLDQMIRILITMKDTGSWEKALEFVPKRKHGGFHPTPEQQPQSGQKKVWEREGPTSRPRPRFSDSEGTGRGSTFRTRDNEFFWGGKDGDRTFKDRDKDFRSQFRDRRPPKTHKDMEYTGGRKERDPTGWTGDENQRPKIRTSLKSRMEEQRNSLGKKRKNWYEDEKP